MSALGPGRGSALSPVSVFGQHVCLPKFELHHTQLPPVVNEAFLARHSIQITSNVVGMRRMYADPGKTPLDNPEEEEDKIERPVITDQDVIDAGEGLQANPFTVSESFNKLEDGDAPHIFSGRAKGSETVFKKDARDTQPVKTLKDVPHGHCVACGKKITGKYTKIRDHGFHHDCFNCAVCGKNLRGIGYFEVKGNFYCRKCQPV